MAVSTKAHLVTPNPDFCSNGSHSGVWHRKTITSCWAGKLVHLKADSEAEGTKCCTIIRVGDEFSAAHAVGDPQKALAMYKDIADAEAVPA